MKLNQINFANKKVQNLSVNNLNMRIYKTRVKTKPDPSPVLVFIHGGGYFFGNLSKRNGSLMSEKSYCLLTQLCDLN